MDFGAIAGLATVAIAVLLAQNRVFYAMAHDGLLPPFFAKIHPRTKTPWISTIISGNYSFIVSRGSKAAIILGIFCVVFSGLLPVDIVGDTTSLSALITYIFVHISVVVVS
jgi:APA family basic amino acid/polyamine antiporter